MSSLTEIQQAILDLPSEERYQLQEWLQEQETEETPQLLAAIDDGVRSIETHGGVPAEEARRRVAEWASR